MNRRCVSMSPGLAPTTRIGPVAGLTNGSVTSVAVSFLSSEVITPPLHVDLGSRPRTPRRARTSAMKRSVGRQRVFEVASLGTVWVTAAGMFIRLLSGLAVEPDAADARLTADRAPGDEQALDLADDEGEHQRERDGRDQRREHLGDDVEAAGLEDRVAEPLGRRHELADDRADQREADRELEAREDVGERGRDHELAEDLPLGRAERAHQVDLIGVDAHRALVGGEQRHHHDRQRRHRDLRGEPGAEPDDHDRRERDDRDRAQRDDERLHHPRDEARVPEQRGRSRCRSRCRPGSRAASRGRSRRCRGTGCRPATS